ICSRSSDESTFAGAYPAAFGFALGTFESETAARAAPATTAATPAATTTSVVNLRFTAFPPCPSLSSDKADSRRTADSRGQRCREGDVSPRLRSAPLLTGHAQFAIPQVSSDAAVPRRVRGSEELVARAAAFPRMPEYVNPVDPPDLG